MRDETPVVLRIAFVAAFVLAGAALFAWIGLVLFRREYARRLAALGEDADVELAFGSPLAIGCSTLCFAARHPSTLRWGFVYAMHLVVGIDPLAALGDEALLDVHRRARS